MDSVTSERDYLDQIESLKQKITHLEIQLRNLQEFVSDREQTCFRLAGQLQHIYYILIQNNSPTKIKKEALEFIRDPYKQRS